MDKQSLAVPANISFDDFGKLDIRIGTVMEASIPSWSHWVMKIKMDLGSPPAGGGERIVFAGIMKFFAPKDLVGRQFPVIVNMEPKKIGPEGDLSCGMIIMAVPKDDEETPPILFSPDSKVPNGTKVR